jgi:SAM-dependent methyltransferase
MESAQYRLHADIEQRHWWFVARRRILRQLLDELVPLPPDAVVVDVGCGTGGNLAWLAGNGRAVGIDISAEAIELARARFPHLRFIAGSAPRDLPADLLAATRLVMLNDVLEHVPDDVRLLSDLVDATHPDTAFLVTVPAGPELWSPHDVAFGHFRRYRLADFENLWSGLPVETRLVGYFNAHLYPVIRCARWWSERRRRAGGLAGTDFSMPPRAVNAILTRIMAAEAGRLTQVARGDRRRAFRRGVSLVAILRRTSGPIAPGAHSIGQDGRSGQFADETALCPA